MVLAAYLPMIQNKAKVARQENCPIGELLGADKESGTLEYKATLRTHDRDGAIFKPLETASLTTVAAFLNSREGGTLLIGVAGDGSDARSYLVTTKPAQAQPGRPRRVRTAPRQHHQHVNGWAAATRCFGSDPQRR